MSEVRAALTAEEWANFKAVERTTEGYDLVLSCEPPHFVDIADETGGVTQYMTRVYAPDLPALAALCLHDQPSGFTRDRLASVLLRNHL